MNERFRVLIESLEPSFQKLISSEAETPKELSKEMPEAGIYLLSDGDKHLFVGRSNRLRQRLQEQCRPSANHNIAPFAFRLARETTGYIKASYTSEGSRTDLEKDPVFQKAFANAKQKVSMMDVRVVEEADPLRQALLELYVSISLSTPHNNFDNH